MIQQLPGGFRLYTVGAIYEIRVSEGRLLHGGFVPREWEDRLGEQPLSAAFDLPLETTLSACGEQLNAVSDNRQTEGYAGRRLQVRSHRTERNGRMESLIIRSEDVQTGLWVEDTYTLHDDGPGIRRTTAVENHGSGPRAVDHLSAFNLYHFPLFGSRRGACDLVLHRFRNQWVFEGEHLTQTLGELGLLDGYCRNCWRFENVSSMSSREYIPCFLLEDTAAGVFTVAQIETSAAWRFEIGGSATRPEGRFYMSGGAGNARYAQQRVTLRPGERYEGPACSLLSVRGEFSNALNALHDHQRTMLIRRSAGDRPLPVVYNEWQNSFGYISEETVHRQLPALREAGVEVYVIDAGWYCPMPRPDDPGYFEWWARAGDWVPDAGRFPAGLEAVAAVVREAGMVPGVWCEIELVGELSRHYREERLLMTRDGGFVQSLNRRFLYFGSEEVREYALGVLEGLVEAGFGYIKIDYNSDSAPGCDNDGCSPGEGLQRHVQGLYAVIDELRRRHPALIIESCASGGMRMDYGLLSRADMCSITDQEDNRYTGEIFYNVSKVVHPSQAGAWSTVKSSFSVDEMAYTLISSMLGRMHISGDIQAFDAEQKALLTRAVALHKSYRRLLEEGRVWYHSPDTLYSEHRGVKILELAAPDGSLLVLAAIGLAGCAGHHTLRPHYADASRVYRTQAFPSGAPGDISGRSLAAGYAFELEQDHQSELVVFQAI